MIRSRGVQTLAVIALVAVCLAVGAVLQQARDTRYPPPPPAEASLYVTSGRALRYMTAGFTALGADLYWIRAIQYYGGNRLLLTGGADPPPSAGPSATPAGYPLLYPLLDLATTLDPLFNIAYRFGAIFLAEAVPGGAGRPDLAIKLLEKGLQYRPDKWEYMQDIGFVHYWWTHDFQAAAGWFDKAGRVPGAPWFIRSLAATTLAEGGDRRSSRLMWESILATAEIEWLKNEAERRLMQLVALDQLDALQPMVDEFTRTTGAPPRDWTPFIRAGRLRGVPLDPSQTAPYEIDAAGRVGLNRKSPLFPLPVEPQGRMAPPA